MVKRIIPIALLSAATLGITACGGGKGEFKKVKFSEYTIVKDVEGKNAQIGDIVEFHLTGRVDTTTVVNTYKQGRPAMAKLDSARNPGDLMDVLPNLSAGDSAHVKIWCDTLLAKMPPEMLSQKPAWMVKGKVIDLYLKLISVKTEEEVKKEMEAKQAEQQKKAEEQKGIDDQKLQEYFAKNNLKPEKTESGVYYTVRTPGSGAAITAGMSASVKYTGKTIEGVAFDSNVDTSIGHHGTDLLTFNVGMGQMIPGFDEGVQHLKKGAKATLYIPSGMGYGANAAGPLIPAYSILVFDVEVVDVKAEKKDNK